MKSIKELLEIYWCRTDEWVTANDPNEDDADICRRMIAALENRGPWRIR